MTPNTPYPAHDAPDNLWTEYARFHGACSGILDRVEQLRESGASLSDSESSELRTMVLNLNAFARVLHGKRAREMRLLAKRAERVLGCANAQHPAEIEEGGESEGDPAVVTS